jgi:hypothetical protein
MRLRHVCVAVTAMWFLTAPAAAHSGRVVLPEPSRPVVTGELRPNLVAAYGFEQPVRGAPASEQDQGASGTAIDLVNGGPEMRVQDPACPASTFAVQTQQVNPAVTGNDDWKAGVYSSTGVSTLHAFNAARETTIMGWVKMTGANPSAGYNAIGLAGVLSGNSQGHDVRALLEIIDVGGTLRLVALGRRVDGASSQTFAADEDWQTLLPLDEWVFLAATFDFDNGTMALYRNGRPLSGFYTLTGDPWGVLGEPEPDLTSATDPRGIKIGGSFPQNTQERNPCNCRMDGLMFLDRLATASEVRRQYEKALHERARVHEARAGRTIPLEITDGGAFTASSDRVACDSGRPLGPAEPADVLRGAWRTRRAWSGTCRQLLVRAEDGAVYGARFRFR